MDAFVTALWLAGLAGWALSHVAFTRQGAVASALALAIVSATNALGARSSLEAVVS